MDNEKLFDLCMKNRGLTNKEIAKYLEMSEITFSRKKHRVNGYCFDRDEIDGIAQVLKLTPEQTLGIFFGNTFQGFDNFVVRKVQ